MAKRSSCTPRRAVWARSPYSSAGRWRPGASSPPRAAAGGRRRHLPAQRGGARADRPRGAPDARQAAAGPLGLMLLAAPPPRPVAEAITRARRGVLVYDFRAAVAQSGRKLRVRVVV